jgi:MFS family permease
MQEFGVSQEVSLLPFVFYLLGLSFGPIMAGPSSETFGRKAVYVSALPMVAVFTLGAGFSQNITSLIACRFFAGLFASPGLSIGMAVVSDFLPPEKRGAPVAVFITMVQMGMLPLMIIEASKLTFTQAPSSALSSVATLWNI